MGEITFAIKAAELAMSAARGTEQYDRLLAEVAKGAQPLAGQSVKWIEELHHSLQAGLETIRSDGRPPIEALGEAIKQSRVTIFGETKVTGVGPHQQRHFLLDTMPAIRNYGANVLGLDLPPQTAPILEKFHRSMGELELPATAEDWRPLQRLHDMKSDPVIMPALKLARDSRMKIVPIGAPEGTFFPERPSIIGHNLMQVADDRSNKVFVWINELHAFNENPANQRWATLPQLLREGLPEQKITTVGNIVDHNWMDGRFRRTTSFSFAVENATMVSTKEIDGTVNSLGRVPYLAHSELGFGQPFFPEQPFDHLIIYPSPLRPNTEVSSQFLAVTQRNIEQNWIWHNQDLGRHFGLRYPTRGGRHSRPLIMAPLHIDM
jgi:hypothetical protein